MAAITVSHLSKFYSVHRKEPGLAGSLKAMFQRNYETVKAVNNISFSAKEGEAIGFIGPNGAGKTTTLKCLSGLLYPTKGTISVAGFTPFERKHDFLKTISLVMGQKNQLWWDLPAMDTFLLNKEIYDIPEDSFKKVVGDLSERLEVTNFLHVPVRKLSLGQRMKMEIIAALVHSPKVLFLDEPTIGLDVIMQKKIREFLKKYNKEYNATILLTSHYMGDVEALCKRVIIINFGQILYDGSLSELIKKYAPHKYISVVFREEVDPKKLATYGETKSYSFPEWTVSVERSKTNEVTAKILEHFAVEDVVIEDAEVEDVISDVFLKAKKK